MKGAAAIDVSRPACGLAWLQVTATTPRAAWLHGGPQDEDILPIALELNSGGGEDNIFGAKGLLAMMPRFAILPGADEEVLGKATAASLHPCSEHLLPLHVCPVHLACHP